MKSKTAIITGAGGGIGRAHAFAFARAGYNVVVNDLGVSRDGSVEGQPLAEVVAQNDGAGMGFRPECSPKGNVALLASIRIGV